MSSKTREALSEIIDLINKWLTDGVMAHWQYSQLFDVADAALAEPLRNCDVGTAEEQYQRWDKYCKSFGAQYDKCDLDSNVHFNLTAKCFACWSQMPYKKEGEE